MVAVREGLVAVAGSWLVGHNTSALRKSELEVDQGCKASSLAHSYPLTRPHLLKGLKLPQSH